MIWHGIWTGGLQLAIGWILVLLSRRWPRATGVLLIAVVAWMVWHIGGSLVRSGHESVVLVLVLIGLPFLVPAVALLASRGDAFEVKGV
jgi:lipopolysaccharide export LptBFGC system permease protein LptF